MMPLEITLAAFFTVKLSILGFRNFTIGQFFEFEMEVIFVDYRLVEWIICRGYKKQKSPL